jgi:oligopeptide transport system ATP-binding protein
LDPLLRLINVKKHIPVGGGMFQRSSEVVLAVDGVTLDVNQGDIIGLVGESGCGKTTLARTILRLTDPTSGNIFFNGRDISSTDKKEMKEIRRDMQIIFQNPFASLNPRRTIEQILAQPILNYRGASNDIRKKVRTLLQMVGLTPPESFMDRYPHELSGGQRQRVGVARGIALEPRLVIADEPVSALDMSVRAQILNLLKDIKEELDLTIMFVTHDLSVVRSLCNRVAVMYLGKLVEVASTVELFEKPAHPYTKALLSSIPIPNPTSARSRRVQVLTGEVPSSITPPSGCRFHPRCPIHSPDCSRMEPKMVGLSATHEVACCSWGYQV